MAGLRRDAQDGDDNFGDMEDVASYQIGFLLVELSRSDLYYAPTLYLLVMGRKSRRIAILLVGYGRGYGDRTDFQSFHTAFWKTCRLMRQAS